ncbi:MAG: sulfatase-like hydrolase/transferase [Anaerolineales bacterium]|nr:sulfatase-like hydrolase/transferase [Anaerolineales bacterium]
MDKQVKETPNVILLTIDTLRADWLGCYGHDRPISPNLDRLASRSIRFEQAITGGSWTQAAFPVMMTSTYASMYGGCLGPLSAERPSLIGTLANSGYATGGFSTTPLLSKTYGYDRGFHYFSDIIPNEKDPSLRGVKGGQRLLRNPATHAVTKLFGANMRPAKVYEPAHVLVDEVMRWLDGVKRPFFAWAHFMDVHWPYHLEEELSTPEEIAQAWKDLVHLHEVNWQDAAITPQQKQHYIDLYEKAIQYTDTQIGRLLDYIDSSPFADNTMIIVVSDHGEEFLERGYWGHVEINLFDEILRVPLIMRLPGQKEGKVVPQQVRTLDIMPTVLDLAGCELPEKVEGISLTPLWNGRPEKYDSPISLSERWRDNTHVVALRTEAFKYIWDSEKPDTPQLYDLLTDPKETRNAIADFPEQAQQFQAHVDAHLARVAETTTFGDVNEPDLDESVINRLRDLGYVE